MEIVAPCTAIVIACGGGERADQPPPTAPVQAPAGRDAALDAESPPGASAGPPAAPEQGPRTIMSYEEALSTPESVDAKDERFHLTDAQLQEPMQRVVAACRVPANTKVTVKTVVKDGRAIGVTVDVRISRPKPKKPPSKAALNAAAKADAKLSASIVACVERAVRAATWVPNHRRDSFTTEF